MAGGHSSARGLGSGHAPEVAEVGAPPTVAVVFAAIQSTMRVPFLSLFWRTLAVDAELLTRVWAVVQPNLATMAAEEAGAKLQRAALISEVTGIASHKAFKGDLVRAEIDYDLRMRINNFNHVARYALPKHLLALALLRATLDGGLPTGSGNPAALPSGMAAGAVAVAPVEPATVRGRAGPLLAEIAAAHSMAAAEDYYRSLARLPDYLGAAWNVLRPVVNDDVYAARVAALWRQARAAATSLPLPTTNLAAALPEGQCEWLAGLVNHFGDHILPRTLIDCAIITALTDGPDAPQRSPFTA